MCAGQYVNNLTLEERIGGYPNGGVFKAETIQLQKLL
jgi:hypothetical protein